MDKEEVEFRFEQAAQRIVGLWIAFAVLSTLVAALLFWDVALSHEASRLQGDADQVAAAADSLASARSGIDVQIEELSGRLESIEGRVGSVEHLAAQIGNKASSSSLDALAGKVDEIKAQWVNGMAQEAQDLVTDREHVDGAIEKVQVALDDSLATLRARHATTQ